MGGCVKGYLLSSKCAEDYGQTQQADAEQHGSECVKGEAADQKGENCSSRGVTEWIR